MKSMINLNRTVKFFIASSVILFSKSTGAQNFSGLTRLDAKSQVVYYSAGADVKAIPLADQVGKVNDYYAKHLGFTPQVNLLVLNGDDWKKFAAHPVYGMPHYKNDHTLIVAAGNNPFWQSFIPPLDKIPAEHAEKIRKVYTGADGELTMEPFFDLLAIHELGHAYHFQDSLNMQRNWLSELFVNIFLHTYVAENEPGLLPALTTFPDMVVALTEPSTLKFTSLSDAHTRYNEIAVNHPQNYGWYQSRWHSAAGKIYDHGGIKVITGLWTALQSERRKLPDDELIAMLGTVSTELGRIITNW